MAVRKCDHPVSFSIGPLPSVLQAGKNAAALTFLSMFVVVVVVVVLLLLSPSQAEDWD